MQVQNAIEYLKTIGAFDENENLTVLGVEIIFLCPFWSSCFDLVSCFKAVLLVCFKYLKRTKTSSLTGCLVGRYLSMLPVEPKLGKMLIFSAIFNCLNPIMTFVAGLSVRDLFLMPANKRDVSYLSIS